MDAQKYALAKERIFNWYYELEGGTPVQKFGTKELRIFESHKSDIRKLEKVFSICKDCA
jgi:hypothetical protein